MSDTARHNLVVALIAALIGAGIGVEATGLGLALGGSLGLWVAALGGIALAIVLLTAPAPTAPPSIEVPSADEAGWAEFRREMRRSRRGVRPLTLLRVVGPGPDEEGLTADLTVRSQLLGRHLRLVDRAWVDDGSVYILLPESPRAAADVLLARIRAISPALLMSNDVRSATFPDDGLTSGAIIAAVHGSAIGDVPIPIRTTVGDTTEIPDYEVADDLNVGGTAAQS